MGLDPARPFVLYVCSAMSPVPEPVEPVFVKEWIDALRASGDPMLRDRRRARAPASGARCGSGAASASTASTTSSSTAAIRSMQTRRRTISIRSTTAARSSASARRAFLEAAIIGRPVLTLQLPAYRMHQDGMLHFRYLLNVEGGLLHTAPDVRIASRAARAGDDGRRLDATSGTGDS